MANYLNFTRAIFNPYNPKVLNEGQFSWFTQDTDQQIGSETLNTIDVWMYDNEGNSWYEKRYQGYGEFGGMDYYELLAKMNGYSEEDLKKGQEMREIGIDLAFKKLKTKDKGKKVLFPALVADGKYNWKRHDFTREAEHDPNQSWYQSEYDPYESKNEDNSEVTEAKGFKNTKDFEAWLEEIEGMPESKIRKIMGKDYIDTPGFWADEKDDYEDIVDFMISNMGNTEFEKLEDYWKNNVEESVNEYNDKIVGGFLDGKDKDFAYKMLDFAEDNDDPRMAKAIMQYIKKNFESLSWEGLKESLGLNEGRSINKISKEHAKVVLDMAKTAGEWKEAEGDRKAELLEKLRALNKQKADLEKELDAAVAGKDRGLELSLQEAEELAYLEIEVNKILEVNNEEA